MATIKKAFTFGKFLPLHKGHEAMIRFALTQCQHLIVIVCASDLETINVQQRCKWVTETFYKTKNLTIIPFEYSEKDLPNTSESSNQVAQLWAKIFAPLINECDAVITSELYGDYVAQALNIIHIPFDKNRQQIPISATLICQQPLTHWQMLPDTVKTDLAFTIVILGTESTGKTTLTKKLSQHYHASSVYEAGRDLIQDSNNFNYEMLPIVAKTHAQAILKAKIENNPIVIIDTDIHITASYAKFCFQRTLAIEPQIYKANHANLYLYLDKDVPFIQDGTRMEEKQRNLLDNSHRQILDEYQIPYITIQGNWQERFEKACMHIDNAIRNYFPWQFRKDTNNL